MDITAKFALFSHEQRLLIIELLQTIDQQLISPELPLEIWDRIYRCSKKNASTLNALKRTCRLFYSGLPPIEEVLDKEGDYLPWIRRFCTLLNKREGFIGRVSYKIEVRGRRFLPWIEIQQEVVPWQQLDTIARIRAVSGVIMVDRPPGTSTFSIPGFMITDDDDLPIAISHITDRDPTAVFKLEPDQGIMQYKICLRKAEKERAINEDRLVKFTEIADRYHTLYLKPMKSPEDMKFLTSLNFRLNIK